MGTKAKANPKLKEAIAIGQRMILGRLALKKITAIIEPAIRYANWRTVISPMSRN
jgi:hypothetical protein